MPRTSRSVAQRLATPTKSKRRRPPRPAAPAPEKTPATPADAGPSVERILDEVVPSSGGPRSAATPTRASATTPAPAAGTAAARRGAPGRAGRAAVIRRRYSEYTEEYRYIWDDLRRIMLVGGVLIVLLVALWFVIE